jgi:uncharacterized protein (TIGR00255 family)
MGLSSMTGFGRGEASARGIKVEVELSSVNRKQFDVRVSLAKALFALEAQVYEMIHKALARGSVTGAIRVGVSETARRRCVHVDVETARAYVRGLRGAARRLGLPDDLSAQSLIHLPEVVQYESLPEGPSKVWPLVERAVAQAIAQLLGMRRQEGMAIQKDLTERLGRLDWRLAQVRKLAPDVPREYRRGLLDRLKSAKVEADDQDQRLVRELALFADRCDISEEIVRLDSHLRQARKMIHGEGPAGRALDFLCQEMFREINTVASKANHAKISLHVVQFKTELEAIREQVQNVE